MKFLVFRFLLPLIIVILLDLYTYQAVKTVSAGLTQTQKKIISVVFWGITAATILLLIAIAVTDYSAWPRSLRTYFTAFFFIIYICKLIIVPFLLVDDLVRLWQWIALKFQNNPQPVNEEGPQITRKQFFSQAALLFATVPAIALVYGMVHGAFNYKVRRVKLYLPNLPDSFNGFKLVQTSDLHLGSFLSKEPLQRAVKLINKQKPDVFVFTGDFVNNKTEEAYPFIDTLKQIEAPLGKFSILGNHDYGDYYRWENPGQKKQNMMDLFNIYEKMGWRLLKNETATINRNGQSIAITGVENWSANGRFPKYGRLNEALQGAKNAAATILLSHDPSHWEAEVVPNAHQVDLTLSGHTHGMQFGIDTKWLKWSPVQYFYKQWADLYRQGSRYLYVNRGLGFLGYPGRAGIRPEITVFEFFRKS